MASESPPFWWQKPDWRAWALEPVSAAYGAAAAWRMRRARREPVALPVLCVGNLTVGGAGKTPVAIALARAASEMDLRPGILSRGHGGGIAKPRLVDAEHDIARSVGDEALLLARAAPVAVTPRRRDGADLLKAEGCDLLIMDDGFQSARIAIDFALVVVDARRGVGNGCVIPGGPLRAPLLTQMPYATAFLRMGEGEAADQIVRSAARSGRAVYAATARPVNPDRFAGRRVLAFAGIGDPQKFFLTLAGVGAEIVTARAFPDHHVYAADELDDLLSSAGRDGLELVTTAKDAVRLRGASPEADQFLRQVGVLEIEAAFESASTPGRIIRETLEAYRRRAF